MEELNVMKEKLEKIIDEYDNKEICNDENIAKKLRDILSVLGEIVDKRNEMHEYLMEIDETIRKAWRIVENLYKECQKKWTH